MVGIGNRPPSLVVVPKTEARITDADSFKRSKKGKYARKIARQKAHRRDRARGSNL